MTFLSRLFTWWNGYTVGTQIFTARNGERVGEDDHGNVYYRAADVPPLGERRWVLYNGEADASKIPPGWHGWMHHRTDVSPADDGYEPHVWQQPWQGNKTGTPRAYRPAGSALTRSSRPAATGDYDAWSPDG